MRVVWQLSEKNGTKRTKVKWPRQKIAKNPLAETALVVTGLIEIRKLERLKRMGKPALAVEDPEEGEKRKS